MSETTVRPAALDDLDLIVSFQRAMARETEGKDLDPARLSRGVRRVFDEPVRGFYLVAERDGRVVGQLMVTYEWSDWRDGDFWWIQSVYVEPESRRRGVYRALHEAALRRARAAAGVCGVRLYVERENATAQAVYEAMGMDRSTYLFYEVEFVPQEGR